MSLNSKWVLPDDMDEWHLAHPYIKEHYMEYTKDLDASISMIIEWHKLKGELELEGMTEKDI